jgi:hypothetical protein
MAVTIEAIKFDYDRTSAARDALTIRRNADDEITPPEWRRQENGRPLTSPAAYARTQGNRLTIAVQLRRTSTASDGTVRVSARGGGILGRVVQDTIVFPSQSTFSDFKVFELFGATIGSVGVGKHDITWDWSLTTDSGTTPQQTTHQIYTLLDLPKAPWGQSGSTFPGYQVPWTDGLRWACDWAAGATTLDDAAARITRELHRLGQTKLQFDTRAGAPSHFTKPGGYKTFYCTRFLRLLGSDTTVKALVNCVDCAVFVSSFVNILGGDLDQARMGPNFNTNLILGIGLPEPYRTTFTFHEVAWKPPANERAQLFDCSLQVDALDPADDHFESPMLGLGIPLGNAVGTQYHHHFVMPGHTARALRDGIRRKIDGTSSSRRPMIPEIERLLKEKYDFASWEQLVTSVDNIFLWHLLQNRTVLSPSGWTSQGSDYYEGESGAPDVAATTWISNEGSAVLRELSYECHSLAEAHLLLLHLVGEFQFPVITRRLDLRGNDAGGIGDVAFGDPADLVSLFARGNVVTFLQNEGPDFVSSSQFARDLDTRILAKPEIEAGSIPMNRFRVAEDKVRVGDHVPIQFIGEDPPAEALYKFFSASGDIYLHNDQLIYRAKQPGHQHITVFAIQAAQKTAWQRLPLFAEASDQPTLAVDSHNFTQRRNTMAFIFEGYWSSIRPLGEYGPDALRAIDQPPPEQLDLRRNGLIKIDRRDEATGDVTGTYIDLRNTGHPVVVGLSGSIRFLGADTYAFVLRHEEPVGTGRQVIYEGKTVASDQSDRPVFVVAGRFRRTPAGVNADDAAEIRDGQEEGVWVATKP